MNGIDISSWQAGIDLSVVPHDFVIIKATQGCDYFNLDFTRAFNQAKEIGSCTGVYHYAGGNDPKQEADYFLSKVQNAIGNSVLALDWEIADNSSWGINDFEWCKTWVDYVAEKTGVKPILYISAHYMNMFQNIGDYGMWVAQYPDYNITGYQETPWNEGAYTCAIRQYSSNGRLVGYNSALDLNKFYGDKIAWNKYCVSSKNSIPIQKKKVNRTHIMTAPAELLAKEVLYGLYGNGQERINILGNRYQEVQDIVNELME